MTIHCFATAVFCVTQMMLLPNSAISVHICLQTPVTPIEILHYVCESKSLVDTFQEIKQFVYSNKDVFSHEI